MYEGGQAMSNNIPYNRTHQRPMSAVISGVKIRGSFKQKAFELGKYNKVILPKRMPADLGRGEIVEIAVMSMLGRVSLFYESYYNEKLDVSFDYWDDITRKIDMRVNGHKIDLKSRYSSDIARNLIPGPGIQVQIIDMQYDYPGIQNLFSILQTVGALKPIPNQLIKEINYLWELYLSFTVMRDNEIYYKHCMHDELDNLMLYIDEFPSIKEFPDYKQIACMFVADTLEEVITQNPIELMCEIVPDPEIIVEAPTKEEIEARRKYQESALKLENHFEQKGITAHNLFSKFKLDPFKSFGIDSEETLLILLTEMFPAIAHKLQYYSFLKIPKGGEFKLSYRALHAKVVSVFQTPEEINELISIKWVEENIYKGFLGEHFKGSLYQFVKFINPDINKWELSNLPLEEYKDTDRKMMIDMLIEKLGLNSSVMRLLQPKSLNTERIGEILSIQYGEFELFEIIKKRLIDLKK